MPGSAFPKASLLLPAAILESTEQTAYQIPLNQFHEEQILRITFLVSRFSCSFFFLGGYGHSKCLLCFRIKEKKLGP